MNEKRFVLCKKGDVEYIEDNGCIQLYGFDVLCEMLNEQQATIKMYEEGLTMKIKKINEQKALIKKLQDLCGESDGENAKLRIENKRLQEENEQLRRDEQLYAKEILRLKQELKESQMLKLGGDY